MGASHQGQRPTSTDVAREAGVSRATVSYVLNGTPHQKISEDARRRVLDAAQRLGYTPSAVARALRSGRSELVLFLAPDWPIGSRVGAFLEQLSSALATRGLTFVVHPATSDRPISAVWKAMTPAAVLTIGSLAPAELAAMRAAGVAVTMALLNSSDDDSTKTAEHVTTQAVPEHRTGYLQAEHLANTGHRRIGYALPDDPRLSDLAAVRLEGARTACAERSLPDPAALAMPLTVKGGTTAVRKWRRMSPPVTGVCAYNDEWALAVLAGMRALRLSAPNAIAVVGVDDIPAAALAAPPLTTVTSDMSAMAKHVAESIVRSLSGAEPPQPADFGHPQIVVRESAP